MWHCCSCECFSKISSQPGSLTWRSQQHQDPKFCKCSSLSHEFQKLFLSTCQHLLKVASSLLHCSLASTHPLCSAGPQALEKVLPLLWESWDSTSALSMYSFRRCHWLRAVWWKQKNIGLSPAIPSHCMSTMRLWYYTCSDFTENWLCLEVSGEDILQWSHTMNGPHPNHIERRSFWGSFPHFSSFTFVMSGQEW